MKEELKMLTKQSGQVVIILLLILVVALAIGLAVVSRSINEISTATKTEQSTRAFSAAEAGLEKLIQQGTGTVEVDFSGNNTVAEAIFSGELPKEGVALEYPPFGKESFAQFWLADPSPSANDYTYDSFNIYFGDSDQDYSSSADKQNNKPAIEVNVITKNGSNFASVRSFFDSNIDRQSNNFNSCIGGIPLDSQIATNYGDSRKFYCQVTVSYSGTPVLARVRLLYTNTSHPVALQPISGSLPHQARMYTSTGTSGNIQRTLQVFKEESVMPFFFDYALFSAGQVSK